MTNVQIKFRILQFDQVFPDQNPSSVLEVNQMLMIMSAH